MTQETPAELPADNYPSQDASHVPPPPRRSRRSGGLPTWLPLFLLAVVPALVVGLVVYVFAGDEDSGGGTDTADVLEALIAGGAGDAPSFRGQLPPGFPQDFPAYKSGKINVSFVLESQQGARYLVFYTTKDSPDEVYAYFTQALDKEPWQVEVARSSDDLTAMLFSRPDNPDIEGEVRVHQASANADTVIYITVDNVTASAAGAVPDKPFVLGESRPLPATFPSDIPIYKGKRTDTTVVLTQFGRGGGMNNFIVSFLTKDSQVDVLDFYRQEFQKRGWTVTDSQSSSTSFALGIDFNDGQRQEIKGSVSADSFDDDATYTQVNLQLEVSARRGRGN